MSSKAKIASAGSLTGPVPTQEAGPGALAGTLIATRSLGESAAHRLPRRGAAHPGGILPHPPVRVKAGRSVAQSPRDGVKVVIVGVVATCGSPGGARSWILAYPP